MSVEVIDWGVIDYVEARERQLAAVDERVSGTVDHDRLIYCEHPAVVTVGRKTPADAPRPDHIPVVEVARGGEATWHGPGQLVGYPIVLLDTPGRGRDVHAFLRGLEAAVIDACNDLGVPAHRWEEHTGIFVRQDGVERKIGSLGIAVRRWVTYHGFSLNLTTSPADFAGIEPCGFQPETMACCADFLDAPPTREAAMAAITRRVNTFLG
ncbi:MAG: lipoyl(octanoyl) transferase LipB [Planctomycetota bacterium]